jgi:Holliday junction resolvasome RuvABC endonuclease subunit
MPVASKSYVGLDLSLSSTGICLKTGSEIRVETIKSKPDTAENDLARLKYIVAEIMRRIPKSVSMICVEDFFTPGNAQQVGAAIKLAMLGTAMRLALWEAGMPFFVVSPNSLKKYILQTGKGQKSLIIMAVYRRWGFEVKDDNQADGCVLAHIAEQLDYQFHGQKGSDQTKAQEEVIAKLVATKTERGYNL